MKRKILIISIIATIFLMISNVSAVPNIECEFVENNIEQLEILIKEQTQNKSLREKIGLTFFWLGWSIVVGGSFINPVFFWIGYVIAWLGVIIGDLSDMPIQDYFPNANSI